FGEIPKWPKGADCKSAGKRLRGFKSSPPHHYSVGGNSSVVERQPSKLGVAGSNPVSRSKFRACAHVAQSAERVLGKDEVSGSIPDMGSRIYRRASADGVPAPRRPAACTAFIATIATANGRARGMAKAKYERTKPHVKVGTLGHIDHGKTTLT